MQTNKEEKTPLLLTDTEKYNVECFFNDTHAMIEAHSVMINEHSDRLASIFRCLNGMHELLVEELFVFDTNNLIKVNELQEKMHSPPSDDEQAN